MGGCLGGGSSINFMMYTRAQAVDYDSFKTEGWYAKDLIPLSNKLETYHPKGEGHDQSKHGHDGPIHISDGGFRTEAGRLFLNAAKEVGHKEIVDLQDFEANGAFSVSDCIINAWHSCVALLIKMQPRNGNDMLVQMANDKMQLIVMYIH